MIGEWFGNYRALSLLGEGGMGAVYLAEHPGIGRRVAVKVLRTEMDHDPQLLTRFLNEARAANAIRHPNIIEVLDSGRTEKGKSYLVMELLEGEALSARIKRLSRLDERSAIEIAMQSAAGLGAAHSKGIIHRDLKPDNIFIIPEPSDIGRERVKILDFGIAKLHTIAGDSLKTRTGTLMGTPVYMSPEQCLGTKEVDQRSDIYALGIILYEMLTGRPPFVSPGFGELLSMHLHDTPAPVRHFAPQVTAEVEAIVGHMLAKKPEDRFQLMNEVRGALAAAAGLPQSVGPEHKLGPTDPFGSVANSLPYSGTAILPATTLTPGGLQSVVASRESSLKSPRGPWLTVAIASFLGLAILGAALLRRGAQPTPHTPSVTTEPRPTKPPAGPTLPMVQLRIESTPVGARIVRVADGFLLGTTPGTVELRSSTEPLRLRLEMEGFLTLTREVSLTSSTTLSVVLEAIPEKPAPTPKKYGTTHGTGKAHTAAPTDEPAKM